MEPSDDNRKPCRSCGQRIAPNVDPCPGCGAARPHRSGGVDWGVVVLLVILSLIGVLGWILVEQLVLPAVTGEPTPRRESPPDPTRQTPPPAETDETQRNLGSETREGAPAETVDLLEQLGDVRSATRAERRLFDKLRPAERTLRRMRMEATQSGMPQIWKQAIDEQETRVTELKRELRDLRAARKK